MGFLTGAIGSAIGGGLGSLVGHAGQGADIAHKLTDWLPFKKGGRVGAKAKGKKAKVVKAKKEVKAAAISLKKKVVKLKKAMRGC